MLSVNNIEVIYSNVVLVLRGVSLEVKEKSITALLGANGAGKSTTLKAISGLLHTELGRVSKGHILFNGKRIERFGPEDIAESGIVQVMERRRVFEHLTVEENLIVGASPVKGKHDLKKDIDGAYTFFPRLKYLRSQTSGYLSGGEQQMLVIGRAIMAHPQVLLLDEPSLGLSPLITKEIFRVVKSINLEEGTSILLVEQNALAGFSVADYGYIMENGRIVLNGPPDSLRNNEEVREFYLGYSKAGERMSYRDMKHRKRILWKG